MAETDKSYGRDRPAQLEDQIIRLLMLWEDSVIPASRAGELLAQIVVSPDAKADFLHCTEDGIKALLRRES